MREVATGLLAPPQHLPVVMGPLSQGTTERVGLPSSHFSCSVRIGSQSPLGGSAAISPARSRKQGGRFVRCGRAAESLRSEMEFPRAPMREVLHHTS